ncbi:hypothetical protein FQ142_11515 [Microbacterium sp. ANT_H45B]|uniref:hypothetical protein n=1 Tax=Microbacterium sp. ANT_H45B TaxID=2597346 RepID=UPI0011EF0B81|nr:hypothetical protein [Microbacterium sp. ANT_H45B]KAA0961436.1 hypothetical protein FQ142_11515 [Microbacterium sp. ANT_H45B]
MTRTLDPDRLRSRDRMAFVAAAVCAVAGVLIWTLWVLPIVRSVEAAEDVPLGTTAVVDLEEGERVGIWASGISASLGTMECRAVGPDHDVRPQRGPSALSWDDVLWWMTPRTGFVQSSQFTAAESGAHRVTCRDSLDTYDGRFLVAGDSIGQGSIGLGRNGGVDFAQGTLLAAGAVMCPPLAVSLPLVILGRRLITGARGRRS